MMKQTYDDELRPCLRNKISLIASNIMNKVVHYRSLVPSAPKIIKNAKKQNIFIYIFKQN